MQSPTIVSVGGTSGIGEALVRKLVSLASGDPQVHIVGRSASAADRIMSDLRAVKPSGTFEFHACDLTNVADTHRLVKTIAGRVQRIDLLLLSQGVLTTAGRTETAEGNDRKLMLHYYSRAAIIRGLQSQLEAAQGRVLSVLDAVRGDVSSLKWEDLELKQKGSYTLGSAAKHCISMSDVLLQDLGAKHPQVKYFHAYPGIVKTPLSNALPLYYRLPTQGLFWAMGTSAEHCADYLLYPFLLEEQRLRSEGYEHGGAFFVDSKGGPVRSKKIPTEDERMKVVQHTEELLGRSAAQR